MVSEVWVSTLWRWLDEDVLKPERAAGGPSLEDEEPEVVPVLVDLEVAVPHLSPAVW